MGSSCALQYQWRASVGTELVSERDRLTDRERQVLEHLEQAQSLGVPLTEYASAYDVDVQDLYAGKAQLVKKGILARPAMAEKRDLVPARISTTRGSAVCRLTHSSGWVIEFSALPEAAWICALMRTSADAPT